MFHFGKYLRAHRRVVWTLLTHVLGGSSHCLLFRKGVKLDGFPQPGRQENVPVRSHLATVTP